MKNVLIILLMLNSHFCFSQINEGGEPFTWKKHNSSTENIPMITLPSLDKSKLDAEDKMDEESGRPPRFGYNHEVNLNLLNSGIWTIFENKKVWKLEIYCPKALSINLLYNEFWLPKSGKLYIYRKDKSQIIGAFTEKNNKGTEENVRGFATGILKGEKIVIEFEQSIIDEDAIISINEVVHGYRKTDFNSDLIKNRDFDESDNCQVNINCSPEGDQRQDEKNGVAMYAINGNRTCTGTLVNIDCNDGKLYFLTAYHCLENYGYDAEEDNNIDNITFFWNYESANCNDPSQEPPLITTTGATLVMNHGDVALLELIESPLDTSILTPYMNGWNASDLIISSGGYSIHHPKGDIKKIATTSTNLSDFSGTDFFNPLIIERTTNGFSHIETGSSGSPLFTIDEKVVGTSYAVKDYKCNFSSNQSEVFSRIHPHWESETNTYRQLKHWLAPCDNTVILNGGYLENCEDSVMVDEDLDGYKKVSTNIIIEANAVVKNTSNVSFIAGQSIILNPNFHVESGAKFLAKIDNNCEPHILNPFQSDNIKIRSDDINQKLNEPIIEVYPNLVSNGINIKYKNELNFPHELIVFSFLGKREHFEKVDKSVQKNSKKYIDLVHLSRGTYFITVNTPKDINTIKFIKI